MSSRRRTSHALPYSELEKRKVLSANWLSSPFADADQPLYEAPDAAEVSDHTISTITVAVNGEEVELGANDLLRLSDGDEFRVTDIIYQSPAASGVFAAEGYLNKITSQRDRSEIDYEDGRFSEREANAAADGKGGSIGGLGDSWTAENGFDRLTLSLMHYTESGVEVAVHFQLGVQVELAEMAFDMSVIEEFASRSFEVGQAVEVPTVWMNNGGGTHHTYAEADIFHANDPDTVIWAGAVVGNSGEAISGRFDNTRGGDGFDALWVPEEAGEYVVLFTVDPENSVRESNEENNQFEVTIVVKEAQSGPVGVAEEYNVRSGKTFKGNVLDNDSDPDGDELKVIDFSAPEHGRFNIGSDGTFKYKSSRKFEGVDRFTYTVSDGQNDQVVEVTLNVSKKDNNDRDEEGDDENERDSSDEDRESSAAESSDVTTYEEPAAAPAPEDSGSAPNEIVDPIPGDAEATDTPETGTSDEPASPGESPDQNPGPEVPAEDDPAQNAGPNSNSDPLADFLSSTNFGTNDALGLNEFIDADRFGAGFDFSNLSFPGFYNTDWQAAFDAWLERIFGES